MRSWLNLLLLLLGAVALSASGGFQKQTPGPGAGDDIVFFSARAGNNEIYRMTGDPRFPLRLTHDPASDMDPAISPNGRDVVFTSNRSGNNNEIYLIGASGGAAINLTNVRSSSASRRPSPQAIRSCVMSGLAGVSFPIGVE